MDIDVESIKKKTALYSCVGSEKHTFAKNNFWMGFLGIIELVYLIILALYDLKNNPGLKTKKSYKECLLSSI